MKTNRNNSILSLWQSLPDSKFYGPVGSISRSPERPDLALVHGPESEGELYALLNIATRRVVDEEEFPTSELETLNWFPRWMNVFSDHATEEDDLTPEEQDERRKTLALVPDAIRKWERVLGGPEGIARINAEIKAKHTH